MTFNELNLSEKIKQAVEELGFEEATPVQAATIPLIMDGIDVIGHSQTGSGKTAAFGIPAIEKIDTSDRNVQVLILCPTRELVVQTCDELRKFAKYLFGIKSVPIYGGQPIDRQIKMLKQGAQIVVGTPGRVMDHMARRTLKFQDLKMVILDEADEMLNMGFREDIEKILKDVPETRQTVLFSATMSKDILKITKKYQNEPQLIKIVPKKLEVPAIEQFYYEIGRGEKINSLSLIMDKYNPKLTIIFCNTKRQVDELVNELQTRGYLADGIHGDIKQNIRSQVLAKFKSNKIDVLVATDVAARGIDVDGIDAVINYDIPQDVEYYVHRIGRTGRAGKTGTAYTFAVGRRQIMELRDIQKFTGIKMILKTVPTANEIVDNQISKFIEEIKKTIEKGELDEYTTIVDGLVEENFTTADIATATVKMLLSKKLKAKKKKIEKDEPTESVAGENMVKLNVNIGKSSKISAGHIVAAIAEDSGISGRAIGNIKLLDNSTIVEIPESLVEQVLTGMEKTKIRGFKVTVKRV